jgi:hypothetical protein
MSPRRNVAIFWGAQKSQSVANWTSQVVLSLGAGQCLPILKRDGGRCRSWVKPGKAPSEQKTSALPLIATVARTFKLAAVCHSRTYALGGDLPMKPAPPNTECYAPAVSPAQLRTAPSFTADDQNAWNLLRHKLPPRCQLRAPRAGARSARTYGSLGSHT